MNWRKFISATSALAIVISSFAGLSTTASAENFYTNDYETTGVTADWTTSTTDRFTPVILEENGNHYLSVNQDQRVNNGCVLTSTSLQGVVEAGNDFAMTFDLKLASSNDQYPAVFTVYDAANSKAIFSLTATAKNSTSWIINGNSGNTVTLTGTGPNTITSVPWYKVFIARKGEATYVEIDDANGNAVFEKTLVSSPSASGGLGKMEFVTKRNNANLALDNVVVRSLEDGDTPAGEVASFDVKYVTDDGTELEKTSSGMGMVEDAPVLTADDIANFTENGQKYIYVSDDSNELTISKDPKTVVTVTVRAAQTYEVTVSGSEGTIFANASVFEGDSISYAYPKYITDDKNQVTYVATLTSYSASVSPSADENIEIPYSAYDGVAYFAEHEALGSSSTNESANYSGGKASRAYNDGVVAFTVSESGKYRFTVAGACRNTNNSSVFAVYKNSVAEENLLFDGDVKGASSNSVQTTGTKTSDNIGLETGDVIIVQGNAGETWIDYIYAVQTLSADGVYYKNNFEAGDSAIDWVSPNASDKLTIATDDSDNHYLSYAGFDKGKRSASVDFSALGTSDSYVVEFDAMLSPGTINTSELAIYKKGGLGSANVEATDPIISLQPSDVNSSVWYVNGNEDIQIAIADSYTNNDSWYHFIVAVDGARAYLTVLDADDEVVLEQTGLNKGGQLGGIKFNAGRGDWDSGFDNITVREIQDGDLPEVAQANFDIKYVTDGGIELSKTSWGFGAVGSAPVLHSVDMAGFFENEKKYLYVSDNSADLTIADDNSTVVTVTVHQALNFTVNVVGSEGSVFLNTTVIEGEEVKYSYPIYITDDNNKVTYEFAGTELNQFNRVVYTKTLTPTVDTDIEIPYSEYDGTAYFAEHEDLSPDNVWAPYHGHYSNGAVSRAVPAGVTAFTVLESGLYDITVVGITHKHFEESIFTVYKNSVTADNFIFDGELSESIEINMQSAGVITKEGVMLDAGDTIIVQGEQPYLDYVMAVKKPNEVVVNEFALGDDGYTANATVTNATDEAIDVGLFVAVYNDDGELVSIKLDKATLQMGDTKNLTVANDDGAIVFLWDLTHNNKPLSSPLF